MYRARDIRLDRTVAIKVLPPRLATDPQFRERFQREARSISQLTHPHICTLHDVGDADHTAFLVMEYLEGETLAERLKNGPLPIDEAVDHALEISFGSPVDSFGTAESDHISRPAIWARKGVE